MQYLMVLVVIVGIFVIMAAAALGISYALGAAMRSRSSPVAVTVADPCAQCQADREWYEELPAWKRSLALAWWMANRYSCVARGCR